MVLFHGSRDKGAIAMKIPIDYWVRRTSSLTRSCRSRDRKRTPGRVCVVLGDRVDDSNAPRWLHRSRLAINAHQVTTPMVTICPAVSFPCLSRRLIAKESGTASGSANANANGVSYATPMANALHAHVGSLFRSKTS